MKATTRKAFLTLHTWVGLVAGIVLMIVALSGAALIFRTALERKLDAHRFIVTPGVNRLPIDALVERARAAHPAGSVESVRFYGDPTMPLLVLFSTAEYVHMNPYTGAVLGTRKRYGEGFGWIEGLHKYLTLDPKIGENVNGTFAFIFAGLVVTGIVLWWPATRRALMAGLTLTWTRSGRAWNLNLHRTLGTYAALVILFSALTGIPIALDSTRTVLDVLTLSHRAPPPPPRPAAGTPFVGFDAIAAQINARLPHAVETYIPLPKLGLVPAYAIAADSPHPNARSYVWCEPAGGQVIRFAPYAQASRGYRLYYTLLSLHTSVAGGWLMPLLLLFGTLSVPVLAYTGVASYLARNRRTSESAARRSSGVSPQSPSSA